MGIGCRIKEARERQGLTQIELGKLVGVTGSSITNYENETSHPKEAIMYKLINALKVDANYLFQDCVNLPKKTNDVTLAEYDHIKKYRVLDPHGKKMVDFTLNEEWERSTEGVKVIPISVKEDEEFSGEITQDKNYFKPQAAHNDNESKEQISLMQEDMTILKRS